MVRPLVKLTPWPGGPRIFGILLILALLCFTNASVDVEWCSPSTCKDCADGKCGDCKNMIGDVPAYSCDDRTAVKLSSLFLQWPAWGGCMDKEEVENFSSRLTRALDIKDSSSSWYKPCTTAPLTLLIVFKGSQEELAAFLPRLSETVDNVRKEQGGVLAKHEPETKLSYDITSSLACSWGGFLLYQDPASTTVVCDCPGRDFTDSNEGSYRYCHSKKAVWVEPSVDVDRADHLLPVRWCVRDADCQRYGDWLAFCVNGACACSRKEQTDGWCSESSASNPVLLRIRFGREYGGGECSAAMEEDVAQHVVPRLQYSTLTVRCSRLHMDVLLVFKSETSSGVEELAQKRDTLDQTFKGSGALVLGQYGLVYNGAMVAAESLQTCEVPHANGTVAYNQDCFPISCRPDHTANIGGACVRNSAGAASSGGISSTAVTLTVIACVAAVIGFAIASFVFLKRSGSKERAEHGTEPDAERCSAPAFAEHEPCSLTCPPEHYQG